MASDAILRDLRSKDREDLIRGYLDLYREREAGEPIGILLFTTPPLWEEELKWFESVQRSVASGAKIVVVAEVDGHAVGLCEATRHGPSSPNHEMAHVADLGILVQRAHRGRGVGEALLREVLARCRGRFEIVILSVFADNARAKRLYRKLGFRPYGSLPGGLKRGNRYIDSDLMFLDLRTGAPEGAPRGKSSRKLNRGTLSASAPSPIHGG